jgi:hypothetical protein
MCRASILDGGKRLFIVYNVQIGYEAHPVSYSVVSRN